jgi:hypothetical protein
LTGNLFNAVSADSYLDLVAVLVSAADDLNAGNRRVVAITINPIFLT